MIAYTRILEIYVLIMATIQDGPHNLLYESSDDISLS